MAVLRGRVYALLVLLGVLGCEGRAVGPGADAASASRAASSHPARPEGMIVHLDEQGRPYVPPPELRGAAAAPERTAGEDAPRPSERPAPGGGWMIDLERQGTRR